MSANELQEELSVLRKSSTSLVAMATLFSATTVYFRKDSGLACRVNNCASMTCGDRSLKTDTNNKGLLHEINCFDVRWYNE